MKECNVVLEVGGGVCPPVYAIPEHRITKRFVIYNYFCRKFSCFEAFFGRDKGVIKDCPICKKNDEVVGKFE